MQNFNDVIHLPPQERKKIHFVYCRANHGLPQNISDLPNLYSLTIHHAPDKIWPDSLAQLQELTYLSIQNRDLEELPAAILALPKLTSLLLNAAPIKQLPDALWRLPQLQELNLNRIFLQNTHIDLSHLPNLRAAQIDNCGITTIQDNFAPLIELHTLSLNSNQLTRLPQSLADCQRLENLDISYNPIAEFPEFILTLPYLTACGCKGVEVFHANFRTPELNFGYYSSRRRLAADKELAISLYWLLSGDAERCFDLPLAHLFKALSAPTSIIANTARAVLEQKAETHLAASPITQKSAFILLGRSSRDRKNLKTQLETIGNRLDDKPAAHTTHIIVCKGLTDTNIKQLAASNLPFLFEPTLENYLKNSGTFTLVPDAAQNEPETQQTQSLSDLLLSSDPTNIEIAAQLIHENGLPPELITEVFIAYKRPFESRKLNQLIRDIFYRNASPELWKKAQKKTEIISRIFLPDGWAAYMQGTELNLDKILKFCENYCTEMPPMPERYFNLYPENQWKNLLQDLAKDKDRLFLLHFVKKELQGWVMSLDIFKKVAYYWSDGYPEELFDSQKLEELHTHSNPPRPKQFKDFHKLKNLKVLDMVGWELMGTKFIFEDMPNLKRIRTGGKEKLHLPIDFNIYDEAEFLATDWLVRKH